jgi:hypothetical protein
MHQVAAWTGSNLRYPPFEWSVSLHIRHAECTRMAKCGDITPHDMLILNRACHPSYVFHTESARRRHVSNLTRRWDLWNKSLHQPSHSRDVARHTYKTRGFI